MTVVRRLVLTVVVGALLALTVFGVGWAVKPGGPLSPDDPATSSARAGDAPRSPDRVRLGSPSADAPTTGAPTTDAPGTDVPETPSERPSSPAPTDEPTQAPAPEKPAEPELAPGPALHQQGEKSDDVRKLQARLRQIAWFNTDVTGVYGPVTADAVRGFQEKRGFPATGEIDRRTLDRLVEMTHEPSADELANRSGLDVNTPGALDPRCTTGRAICIDKTSQTLRWVVDGEVERTLDVRFGAEYSPTREGAFVVNFKSRDHVSSLYDSPMPYAMFFSGGQAVHFSSDFLARGYAGASHGCVNVRDEAGVAGLFDDANVGDPVIVYRS